MSSLENLLGDTLIKNNGETISTATLSSKTNIVLYFSAHWCPPCRTFTPMLSKAYKCYIMDKLDSPPSDIEIIFISRDSNNEEFKKYHQEMSFPAVPFEKEKLDQITSHFKVKGIPSLVAISADSGEKVEDSVDLRSMISAYGAQAFPLTPERLQVLKDEEEVKRKQSLKDLYGEEGGISFQISTNKNTSEKLNDMISKYEYVAFLLGDGDSDDSSYNAVKKTIDNINRSSKDGNRCALIYLGWSLYNDNSNHQELSKIFEYYKNLDDKNSEDKVLEDTIANILGKQNAQAPTLAIFCRGSGLCTIDGKCEEADSMVLVTTDTGVKKTLTIGEAAFPWDEASIKTFEEQQKLQEEAIKSNFTDLKFLTESEEGSIIIPPGNDDNKDLRERLFVGDDEGVVALYFSAHWCPPCQAFTPKLVEGFKTLRAGGKKFEVVFISSDRSKEDFEQYYDSMKTDLGDQFLALDFEKRDFKKLISKAFHVRGIPTLVVMKADGTVITKDGVRAFLSSGAMAFPWDDDSVKRIAKENLEKALEKERECEETQLQNGDTVMKRIAGEPKNVQHNVEDKVLSFSEFSTVGAPDKYVESGVLYYELEIAEMGKYPQFGFAQKYTIEQTDKYVTNGVGDYKASWAVDGHRFLKWNESETSWKGKWCKGNILGFAANIDKGMIAVSKDGDWKVEGYGLVFQDENIKHGVYPCFTASTGKVRYSIDEASFKFGPPDDSIWIV